jgi:hypothetical protein
MNAVACSAITSYENVASIYFYNPLQILQSSVIAERTENSIVTITKDSDPDVHYP